MTKAFNTFNIHQLIHKIHNTHISTTIVKFLANYLKSRQQPTSSFTLHTPLTLYTHSPQKKLTPDTKKQSTFNNNSYTFNIPSSQNTSHTNKNSMKTIHTKIVHNFISSTHNKLLNKQPFLLHDSETPLDHYTRRNLAQLRTKISLFILSYLNKISPSFYPSPFCPLCHAHLHDTPHFFTCPKISTTLGPDSVWTDLVKAAELLKSWAVFMGT